MSRETGCAGRNRCAACQACTTPCHKDVTTRESACIADFSLVIPRWAVLKVAQVPDQYLNLPPSISLGQPYKVSEEQYEYGQPNIEYQFVAGITFRLYAHESSQPSPPTDLGDFPAEFISSKSNTYNAWFSGTEYTMKLSTAEPPAVVLQPPADSTTMVPVNIIMESGTKKGSVIKLTELPSKLRNLMCKVQLILRAKIFYSTVPFRKMSGQTMLTAKGTLRLKDEALKLTPHNLRESS